MMAFDAEASSTSLSVIAPVPLWMIRIFTSFVGSFDRLSLSTFDRALHIAFDDDRQFFDFTLLDLAEELVQRKTCAGLSSFSGFDLAERHDASRLEFVFEHLIGVARLRNSLESEHFNGVPAAPLSVWSLLVKHGSHSSHDPRRPQTRRSP